MMIISHIVATYFLGKILKFKTKKQWFFAFLFGVGIDFLDLPHMIRGIRGFLIGETGFNRGGQYYYRSFVQEPISLLWVIPISIWLKTPIPIIFFILQAGMDFICQFEKRPFWPLLNFSTRWGLFPSGTILEFALSLGLFLVILYIKKRTISFYWQKYKNESINWSFFQRSFKKIREVWAQ